MKRRVWAVLVLLVVFAPTWALADTTSVGVQLGATDGTHREPGGTATAPLVPTPILSISHESGCFEGSAEGLPPIGPISISTNGLGMKDITLTYADAVLRYWNPSHTLAIGVGDTLYNQRTDFLAFVSSAGQRTIVDRSRVTGTRYELTARKPLAKNNFAQVRIAVNPAMHGRFTQTDVMSAQLGPTYTTQPIWERASQIDADARVTHEFGEYAVSYGVRYLNYNAGFEGWSAPVFADANSLVMPYVALVRTFGGAQKILANGPAPACVRPHVPLHVQAFVGGDLFTGVHQDYVGSVRHTVVAALPLYALRASHNRYELQLEDVPAIGPVRGAPQRGVRAYSVKAGYGDAMLRYWLPAGGVGFGIGDALYVSQERFGSHTNQAVRAAGLRYEMLRRMSLGRSTQMIVALAIAPSMHQRSTYWFDNLHGPGGFGFGVGSLVDARLQFETAYGPRHRWVYGVRYLNYAGGRYFRFDPLEDRSGIIAGFAAWGFPVGR